MENGSSVKTFGRQSKVLSNLNQTVCEQLLADFRLQYPIEEWESGGFFTDTDLLDINCHWLQFGPQKYYNHLALAFLYVILFLIGSCSNLTVIYFLTR